MSDAVIMELIVFFAVTGAVAWVLLILFGVARVVSWLADMFRERRRGPGLDELDGEE